MEKNLQEVLKESGLKVTLARLAILGIFSKDCTPIDAEYIFKKLSNKRINQVTVYRTLASFEKSGILKRVDLRKGSVHYEFDGHHHHHIICVECGKTEGFENCSVDEISKQVLKKSPLFEKINQHSLELFGTCKSCIKG
ncbi:MAG: hypothetical protein RJA61_731 [Candidatus Parcubacteria bacterium]|jgi:Fur family ferric uptake transcriptional regulator